MKNQIRPYDTFFTLLVLLALFISSALIVSPVVSAGMIYVTTFVDEDNGGGDCSLREAIIAASDGSDYGGCTGVSPVENTIVLQEGTYTLTLGGIASPMNIGSPVGDDINLTIVGEGAAKTIIQASTCNPTLSSCTHTHRIFTVSSTAQLTLTGVTLRHGNVVNAGGAVENHGTLIIENSTISANSAGGGGGISAQSNSILVLDGAMVTGNKAVNLGGGIHGDICDTITVTGNSKISGNTAGQLGGGIFTQDCQANINDSEISGNAAVMGGGGINNRGSLTLSGGTKLANNTTAGDGAGIRNESGNTLTISNSTIEGNTAQGSGGGIMNFGILGLTNSSLTDNSAQVNGGGIHTKSVISENFSMTGGFITGNTAKDDGGGVYIDSTDNDPPHASITLTSVTLSENHAEQGSGGGIYSFLSVNLTLDGCTFESNTANVEGGGVSIYGNRGDIEIINSTFSSNTAGWFGGAIANVSTYSNLILTHSTLYKNAAKSGGGIYNSGFSSELHIRNTIIAQSTNLDCDNQNSEVMENVSSLVQSHYGCSTPFLTSDPMLDVLGDYGGPTHTHALLPGSPAIDAASLAFCVAFDQRGIERPFGAGCDIGAFEYFELDEPDPDDPIGNFLFLPLILR